MRFEVDTPVLLAIFLGMGWEIEVSAIESLNRNTSSRSKNILVKSVQAKRRSAPFAELDKVSWV